MTDAPVYVDRNDDDAIDFDFDRFEAIDTPRTTTPARAPVAAQPGPAPAPVGGDRDNPFRDVETHAEVLELIGFDGDGPNSEGWFRGYCRGGGDHENKGGPTLGIRVVEKNGRRRLLANCFSKKGACDSSSLYQQMKHISLDDVPEEWVVVLDGSKPDPYAHGKAERVAGDLGPTIKKVKHEDPEVSEEQVAEDWAKVDRYLLRAKERLVRGLKEGSGKADAVAAYMEYRHGLDSYTITKDPGFWHPDPFTGESETPTIGEGSDGNIVVGSLSTGDLPPGAQFRPLVKHGKEDGPRPIKVTWGKPHAQSFIYHMMGTKRSKDSAAPYIAVLSEGISDGPSAAMQMGITMSLMLTGGTNKPHETGPRPSGVHALDRLDALCGAEGIERKDLTVIVLGDPDATGEEMDQNWGKFFSDLGFPTYTRNNEHPLWGIPQPYDPAADNPDLTDVIGIRRDARGDAWISAEELMSAVVPFKAKAKTPGTKLATVSAEEVAAAVSATAPATGRTPPNLPRKLLKVGEEPGTFTAEELLTIPREVCELPIDQEGVARRAHAWSQGRLIFTRVGDSKEVTYLMWEVFPEGGGAFSVASEDAVIAFLGTVVNHIDLEKEFIVGRGATEEDRAADAKRQVDWITKQIERAKTDAFKKSVLNTFRGLPGVEVAQKDLNSQGDLLNTAGGTWDLRAGHLRDADPADLITWSSPWDGVIVPIPEGQKTPMPKWMEDTVLTWDTDLTTEVRVKKDGTEKIVPRPGVEQYSGLEYIRNILAQGVTGYAYRTLAHPTGDGGTGKSEFFLGFKEALGDYGAVSMPSLWEAPARSSGGGDTPSPGLIELAGKRFVVVDEIEKMTLNGALVKTFTAGSQMSVRGMHSGVYRTIYPKAVLVMCSNRGLWIDATDSGLVDRTWPLEITKRSYVPDELRVANIAERYKEMESIRGFFSWVLPRAKELINGNLPRYGMPELGLLERKRFFSPGSDPLFLDWLLETTVPIRETFEEEDAPAGRSAKGWAPTVSEMFSSFVRYGTERFQRPNMKRQTFVALLEAHGERVSNRTRRKRGKDRPHQEFVDSRRFVKKTEHFGYGLEDA